MSEESMMSEEANYESWLAIIDELREQSLSKRFQLGENLAGATIKGGSSGREIKKGSLVKLRRLGQDNQHSHKLEPRWEGPYRVHKMASHGQSAWIEDLHSFRVKGRYHINLLSLFIEEKEVGRKEESWRMVAELNAQTQKEVQKYMTNRAKNRKIVMNAQGKNSTEYLKPDVDVADTKYQQQLLGFPQGYGDQEHYEFWKSKAVNFNNFIYPERKTESKHGERKGMSLGSLLSSQ